MYKYTIVSNKSSIKQKHKNNSSKDKNAVREALRCVVAARMCVCVYPFLTHVTNRMSSAVGARDLNVLYVVNIIILQTYNV